MPRCPLCTTDPQNPVWHRFMGQCPKKPGNIRKAQEKAQLIRSESPAPPPSGAKPIDETKATAPVSEQRGPGRPRKNVLGFIRKETQAIATDVAKPKEEFDWILPEEANARLWQSALSFVRQTLNLFNRFMGMPPVPEEVMHFGKADLDSINEAFRAPTSKLLYTMGFKTVDSAVRFTLVFSGFSLFGLMVVQTGLWYWENLPKSERFLKWREKQKEKASRFRERQQAEAAARAQKREAIDTTAKPAGAG